MNNLLAYQSALDFLANQFVFDKELVECLVATSFSCMVMPNKY